MNTPKSVASHPQSKPATRPDEIALITELPWLVRQQLNSLLRDHYSLGDIARWLRQQWNAVGCQPDKEACRLALARYRSSIEFSDWLAQDWRRRTLDTILQKRGGNPVAVSVLLLKLESQAGLEN